LCLPVAVVLGIRLCLRGSIDLRLRLARALVPAVLVLGATVAFTGYYNWRVTGDALLFPRVLYQRVYWDVPVFVWQPIIPAVAHGGHLFTGFFENPNTSKFLGHSLAAQLLKKCREGASFFLGPILLVPFVTLPWLVFDRRIRFLEIQLVWCGVWLLMVYWFEPHYAAPLTASIYIIVSQAIRHLRQWKWKSYRVGVFASRLIVVLLVARIFSPGTEVVHPLLREFNLSRAEIAQQLRATPEKHLVIVRYSPDHDVLNEWVYNAADLDDARIVWAREIPGRDIKPLLDYYHDRKIWVLDADADHPQVEPYSGSDATGQSSR